MDACNYGKLWLMVCAVARMVRADRPVSGLRPREPGDWIAGRPGRRTGERLVPAFRTPAAHALRCVLLEAGKRVPLLRWPGCNQLRSSNAPSFMPQAKASHSPGVKYSLGPEGFLESRITNSLSASAL